LFPFLPSWDRTSVRRNFLAFLIFCDLSRNSLFCKAEMALSSMQEGFEPMDVSEENDNDAVAGNGQRAPLPGLHDKCYYVY
jgi:hypothetical protein